MAFTIAIDELGIGNEKVAYVTLPANKNTVIDAMDRARIFGETFARIENCDEFPELNGYEFNEEPTLGELNFLAKRLKEIARDTSEKYAYRGLLQKGFNTINEAINRTYNLQTVPVYPCRNVYQYGEIVLDNEMLEELDDVPDEVYELLDPDKVGRAMAEREGGVFIDGYYVITSGYEPVLVYDEKIPEPPENWIFKLEVAGVPERAEDLDKMKKEILTFPADEKHMQEIAKALGERYIDECISMNFESAIPQIRDDCFESMEDIYKLNDIARRISEMPREETAKFKAVLQSETPSDLDRIEFILNDIDSYEFNNTLDRTEYAEEFISRILPPNISKNVFSIVCNDSLGDMILEEMKCKFTDYGIISECGGHLFSQDDEPEQEQKNDFEMGGIT